MKRNGILMLVFVAIATCGLCNVNVNKTAETSPPGPAGIISNYK